MEQELFIAVVAGLGGMLGWGFADFFAKKTIDVIGDIASLAWGHIFGALALILLVLFRALSQGTALELPSSPATWLFLLTFGALQAAIYYLVYKGFGKGQISVLNPVFASFSGLTALLSILIFGERLTGFMSLGLITLFVGILLISADIDALKARRFSLARVPGFREVGFATILAGFWTLFWDKLLGGEDWLMYTAIMYVFMTVCILAACAAQKVSLKAVPVPLWKFLVLIGFGETLAYAAVSLGYSSTSLTSVVALLSGAFSLPVILLARLFLKERVALSQTIGSLAVVAGIMLLAVL